MGYVLRNKCGNAVVVDHKDIVSVERNGYGTLLILNKNNYGLSRLSIEMSFEGFMTLYNSEPSVI